MENLKTVQYLLTTAAGKRLIAKAVCELTELKEALKNNTVVIVAGTTNSYVAEELLALTGESEDFSKKAFFRGVTIAPGEKIEPKESFIGDIVLEKGKWLKGQTLFDVAAQLGKGDIVLKGGNAVNASRTLAGVLIGHPELGTVGALLPAVIGRRAQLIIPIGLEKRVLGDLHEIAAKLNTPTGSGLRMMPVGGTIITELEAVELLTGAKAELIAAGGILGAEGSCWITITGNDHQLSLASEILAEITHEPPFMR